MISVTHLRNGTNFLLRDEPHRVMEYKHTHMSRGGGTIRVKVKNLHSGAIFEQTFKSGEKIEEISVNKKPMTYLYQEGDDFVFMDPSSYNQITVREDVLGEKTAYLKEGEEFWLLYWMDMEEEEEYLDIELPSKMTFTIADAAPGERGDSASNVYKDAVLENGLKVRVPLFVNTGEKIRVSTLDGSYVERA